MVLPLDSTNIKLSILMLLDITNIMLGGVGKVLFFLKKKKNKRLHTPPSMAIIFNITE